MRIKKLQFILIMLITSVIYSQDYTLSHYATWMYKAITYLPTKANPTSTTTELIHGGATSTPYVGTNFITEATYERNNIARFAASFALFGNNLNLAEHEVITSALLEISTYSITGTGNFKISFIGHNFIGQTDNELWDEYGGGTFIVNLPYSSGGTIDVTNLIKNNLGEFILLGFSETGNLDVVGQAFINLTIKVWTNIESPLNLTIQNVMDSYNGGKISIDGILQSSPISPNNRYIGDNIIFAAYEGSDQINNGYNWVFNDTEAPFSKSEWQVKNTNNVVFSHFNYIASISHPLTADDNNATYQAVLKKQYKITFKNQFVGFPNFGGQIIVNNGAPENAPSAVYKVVEQNTITATAVNSQTISTNVGIKYTFENWQDESGVNVGSNLTLTASPNGNKIYTAKMKGTPMFSNSDYRNLRSNYGFRNIGDPVKLTWNEHPNSHVTQYRIYRLVFKNGLNDGPRLVATVNRGTTSWSDLYAIGSSTASISLFYNVQAYYSIESTESSSEYIHLNGEIPFKASNDKDTDNLGITEFAIGNFPNPFNPTTIVNYQLPYSGMVRIKVYDMLGKEVVGLVNNIKDAGIYNVRFDGSNLASGTYLIHIQVTPTDVSKSAYVKTKKMVLLK